MNLSKTTLSLLLLGTLGLGLTPAFAADAPTPAMGSGMMGAGPMGAGPMGAGHRAMEKGRWMKEAPVPMLMPIVFRHMAELNLSAEQKKALEDWRTSHMAQWHKWRSSMLEHNRALRDALLKGETGAALAPLKAAVDKDHREMLEHGIRQVEFLHHTLTPAQWEKVTTLYTHLGK
ncbi:hypothetical protein [Acidithiobacillus sp.]